MTRRGVTSRAGAHETPAALGYRMPAEWEPHGRTWLAWPHNQSDWPGKAAAIPWVLAEVARQLHQTERVGIVVRSAQEQRSVRRLLERVGVPSGAVDFFRHPTDRSWTRDYLPSFVIRRTSRGRQHLGAVKWRFDGWARYSNYRQDEMAGAAVAARFACRTWEPTYQSRGRSRRVVMEGGAIDVDGEGTALASEQCLLSGRRARNPGLGRAGTEQVFCEHLAARKVLWVSGGLAGDDTSGHVDDFVRFVAPAKIVLSEARDRRDPNHRSLARARERLTGVVDARGRKLEIVALPLPAPLFFGKDRLPASYANFYIANRTVLVPTFNDPADRVALGLLSELFAGRRVVGIHCVDLVLGLGTLPPQDEGLKSA